jgi:hypothetical protein
VNSIGLPRFYLASDVSRGRLVVVVVQAGVVDVVVVVVETEVVVDDLGLLDVDVVVKTVVVDSMDVVDVDSTKLKVNAFKFKLLFIL